MVKESVKEMKPYNPPLDGRREYIRLDFNENTIGPSPKVVEALRNVSGDDVSAYPEYSQLYSKLSSYLGVGEDSLVITNASDEGIKLVFDVLLEGDLVLPVPTFTMFEFYAQLAGAKINKVPYNEDLSFPTSKVLETAGEMVVLVSPNNPTGTVIPRSDIIKILETGKIVLLDEAYVQFSGESCKDLVSKYENLIILQTFSKAFGMAGLRLGYIIANKSIVQYLKKAQSPYSVNQMAVIGAIAALEDTSYVDEYVKMVKESKEVMVKGLEGLGYEVFESKANFVLVKVDDVNLFVSKLKENGILVRDRSKYLENTVRVTVGSLEQTSKLLEVLK